MTTLHELLRLHGRLTTVHVERWVARGLLRPSGSAESWSFEQIDVARAFAEHPPATREAIAGSLRRLARS